MSYDSYRARITANGGSIVDSTKLTTKRSQMKEILNSPLRADVYLNSDTTTYACIPRIIKNDNEFASFLFMPDTVLDRGYYIHYGKLTYITTMNNSSDSHPIVNAQLCNHSFPVRTEVTKVLIGNDPRTGRPIYEDVITPILIPCVVESRYTHANDTRSFQLPEDRLEISLQYTVSNDIDLNFEFDMYDDRYRIVDIDSTQTLNEIGIMKIIAEKV